MSIEKDYNQQINETLQLEAAGFTKEEIEELDRRHANIGKVHSYSRKEILEELGYES